MAGGAQKTSQFNQATSVTQADQVPLLQGGELKRVTVGILTGAPDFGWSATGESWTYSSYNSTYKIGIVTVPSDATVKYQPGMRVRFSQTTGGVKYAIIHDVSSTTLTLFFGTDYSLANEAIGTPYYSPLDTPIGFNKNPKKWMMSTTFSADANQASPSANVWYNIGGYSLPIGIGAWRTWYEVVGESSSAVSTSNYSVMWATLSTANNTQGPADLVSKEFGNNTGAEGFTLHKETVLEVASNTTYYINFKTDNATTNNIQVYGGAAAATYIRAVSAYL